VPFMAVVRNIIIIINIFLHARLYAEIWGSANIKI
jgi:hypothetical protein